MSKRKTQRGANPLRPKTPEVTEGVEDVNPPSRPTAAAATPSLNLNTVVPLQIFRLFKSGLSLAEMGTVVDQALQLFDNLYAHLELKKAMLAVDPVQAFMLLKRRLQSADSYDEETFHREMIEIFNSVRDLHTNYMLPEPYASSVAFLPFLIKQYYDQQGLAHYIVSRVLPEAEQAPFGPGVEITHWNGMLIANAIALNAEDHAGSNAAARYIRGLMTLTSRPMLTDLPPREDWVTLTYRHVGGVGEIRFPWNVMQPPPSPQKIPTTGPAASASGAGMAVGLDINLEVTNRARQILFAPESAQRELHLPELVVQAAAATPASVSTDVQANATVFPNELEFGVRETKYGTFGYLGIRSFDVQDFAAFVYEVVRILSLLPQNGLIIDVRGNPGGNILAGENLLQLFTSRRIEPEPVGFRNTLGTQQFARNDYLKQWFLSIHQSVETGETYSQYFPALGPRDVQCDWAKVPGQVDLADRRRVLQHDGLFLRRVSGSSNRADPRDEREDRGRRR